MLIASLGELALLPDDLDAVAALADDGRLDAADPELVLVSTTAPLTRDQIAAWPRLRHVVVCGTSLGRLDADALAERGITVDNVTHYGDHPAAELAFAQLVFVTRGLARVAWRDDPHELAGMRCVIVGAGDLGRAMAHLALAYGMEVGYISRSAKPDWEAVGVTRGTRAELLPAADVVILTGPTDVEVLSASDVALLRDRTILVQASAGRALDDAAFRAWLARPGNVAIFDLGAGEETYAAYAGLPQVVFPRQVGGLSIETKRRLGARVRELVAARTGAAQTGASASD